MRKNIAYCSLLLLFISCKATEPVHVPQTGLAGAHTALQHDPSSVSLSKHNPPNVVFDAKDSTVLEGQAKEVIEKTGFTYVRLQTKSEAVWVALVDTKVSVGQKLFVVEQSVMKNFTSKSLGRTFDRIIFGTVVKK